MSDKILKTICFKDLNLSNYFDLFAVLRALIFLSFPVFLMDSVNQLEEQEELERSQKWLLSGILYSTIYKQYGMNRYLIDEKKVKNSVFILKSNGITKVFSERLMKSCECYVCSNALSRDKRGLRTPKSSLVFYHICSYYSLMTVQSPILWTLNQV